MVFEFQLTEEISILTKFQQYSSDDVQVENKEPIHRGFMKLMRYFVTHKLHMGGWSDTLQRELVEKEDAVIVLPYDPSTDTFVLIEQFRVGAIRENSTPWLLECVAGINDKNESPEALCHRELFEEAGLTTTKLVKAMTYFSSPGASTELLHVYVAVVDASNAGGVHGVDAESEDILVHTVSREQVKTWLADNTINNAGTIIALQWFLLNEDKLGLNA